MATSGLESVTKNLQDASKKTVSSEDSPDLTFVSDGDRGLVELTEQIHSRRCNECVVVAMN